MGVGGRSGVHDFSAKNPRLLAEPGAQVFWIARRTGQHGALWPKGLSVAAWCCGPLD
jgi:hypothetical protein